MVANPIVLGEASQAALSDGSRLNLVRWGAGLPTYVLIHGLGDAACVWRHFAESSARRGASIAVDLRGHGDSPWSASAEYTVAKFAADVIGVLDTINIERAVLVGHSLGAQVAIHAAASRPGRVRGLVLVEGGPETNKTGMAAIRNSFGSQQRKFRSAAEYAEHLSRKWPQAQEQLLRSIAPQLLRSCATGEFELKFDPRAASALGHVDDALLWALLRSVTCGMMVIRGAWSSVLPRSATEAMAGRLANCRAHTIRRAGHAVMLENPDEFFDVVDPFTAGCVQG